MLGRSAGRPSRANSNGRIGMTEHNPDVDEISISDEDMELAMRVYKPRGGEEFESSGRLHPNTIMVLAGRKRVILRGTSLRRRQWLAELCRRLGERSTVEKATHQPDQRFRCL